MASEGSTPSLVCLHAPSHGNIMGSGHSKPKVLKTMIKNFRKGLPGNYGVKITPSKLKTLCESESPTFGVGWLPEGTLDVPTGDHPDQFPYIDYWLGVAQTLAPWM